MMKEVCRLEWTWLCQFDVEWVSVAVGVTNVILLVMTLVITAKATLAATRAAKASEAAIEIGQRAYLSIEPDVEGHFRSETELNQVAVKWRLVNAGPTPAKFADFAWVRFDRIDGATAIPTTGVRFKFSSIAGHQSYTRIASYLKADFLKRSYEESRPIYYFARVTYRDVFTKNLHWDETIFGLKVPSDPWTWKLGWGAPGMIFAVTDPQDRKTIANAARPYLDALSAQNLSEGGD